MLVTRSSASRRIAWTPAACRPIERTLFSLNRSAFPFSVTFPAFSDGIASPELMQQVTRGADYRQWTKDFLGGE